MKAAGYVVGILTALLLAACGSRPASRETGPYTDSTHRGDYTDDASTWADSVASAMTLEEQVGQLFMPGTYTLGDPATMAMLRRYAEEMHVGGIILLKGDLISARTIADSLAVWSSAPPFISIDAEDGLGMRLQDAPKYPLSSSLSHFDASTLYDYGYELARQSTATGINLVLGPVLDVVPAGIEGFIGKRSFGADPQTAASLGVAYARGLEDGGVMSAAKHFPGHGSADTDSHKALPVISKSLDELRRTDLLPFREYIDGGLSAVMIGHLAVPALDSISASASVSAPIITGCLRRDMKFRGLVLTDAMNMGGAGGASAIDAIRAGADIILAPTDTKLEINRILRAVRDGDLSRDIILDRVRRILFYKYRFALLNRRSVAPATLQSTVNSESAQALRRRLERGS